VRKLAGRSVVRKGRKKVGENSVDWKDNSMDKRLVEQKVVLRELPLVGYSVERKVDPMGKTMGDKMDCSLDDLKEQQLDSRRLS
jgi:hypothetical protein